jgi:hypothetical protein
MTAKQGTAKQTVPGALLRATLVLALVGVFMTAGGKSQARSLEEAIALFGADARARLAPHFAAAGLSYPPRRLVFLAMKEEAELEVWAGSGDEMILLRRYPIKRLSGQAGPKLREGDRQVPEGIYRIVGFNPNSRFHLSMKLDYPNAFDRHHAHREGRSEPGSDIFIHGKAASIGCLAMGDLAIEELFVLVNDSGRENVQVLIAPRDPRPIGRLTASPALPPWTGELYREITSAFLPFDRGG